MAFNYFPAGYQPAQMLYPQQNIPQQQNVQQQQTSMIWIQGEAAAKSYLVAPNSTVTLWDSESPTIYVKSTDSAGIPSMRIFDYKERTAEPRAEAKKMDYAPISDFENLKNDVEEIKKYLKTEKKTEKEGKK